MHKPILSLSSLQVKHFLFLQFSLYSITAVVSSGFIILGVEGIITFVDGVITIGD